MSAEELRQIIERADKAITAEDFDTLMEIYAEDATLVVRPGLHASGKERIRKAFEAIATHFDHKLSVSQGRMKVVEAGDTALVIMETLVGTGEDSAVDGPEVRRASYVFRKDGQGRWLCVIDNSYGTDLLDAE
jgi:uncharacterized protein (TIGR02246 family)